jgi:hypothetical protein
VEGAADFVAFDCTSQEKAAHGHVAYAVQEASKAASKGAQNGTLCPGNERSPVISGRKYPKPICDPTFSRYCNARIRRFYSLNLCYLIKKWPISICTKFQYML